MRLSILGRRSEADPPLLIPETIDRVLGQTDPPKSLLPEMH